MRRKNSLTMSVGGRNSFGSHCCSWGPPVQPVVAKFTTCQTLCISVRVYLPCRRGWKWSSFTHGRTFSARPGDSSEIKTVRPVLVQPARSATKLWTTVRLGRARMQITKLPLFVRTSPTFWVMLHGALRHAPTPRRKVCAEWQHAACGLFPGHAGFGNHEGSKVYCWNRSHELKWKQQQSLGQGQCRFACRWWASTERMCFCRSLHPRPGTLLSLLNVFWKKREPTTTGQRKFPICQGSIHEQCDFLPSCRISLPPHAPTPASNAKSFCGKNDVTVISGGIATTTASFLRTGHPLHFLWHSPLIRRSFVLWCGILRILAWKSEGRPRLVSPWSMAHSRIASKKKKGPARRVPAQWWILSNLE